MEKKIVIVMSMIVLLIVSANMETVNAQGIDCFDSCSTGCVNPNPRLAARCERKCQIRCDPGLAAREANRHSR